MDMPEVQPRTRLIEARRQRKLSQKQLAERIGTNYVNVSRWERGITRPGPYFQRKLSQLFGKTEEELDLAGSGDAAVSSTPVSPPQPSTPKPAAPLSAAANASVPLSSSGEAIFDAAIPLLPPVHLVGRNATLPELRERLCGSERVAMTALHGLPGVGKTTLAITLAHDQHIREYFRDGILWAGLGPAPDVSSILSHWSALLGVATPDGGSEDDHEAIAVQLRRTIGERRMLLVIDDAWHLEDALVFKVGGPHCVHLVTTRFPAIASAFAPRSTRVIHELDKDDSIVLLKMLAPQILEREPQKAGELANAVGGLPLALTLLGNYLRLHSYSGQTRRVDAALARLSIAEERLHISEPRGPNERHTSLSSDSPLSLQAVIDVTIQQLNPRQRATLYALSVFPPKPHYFSEDAALYVANCDVERLDTLMDMGLLEYTDTNHYRLHQTIADYARAALLKEADPEEPYERLITYEAGFVEQHRKDYEVLELEYETIIAALEGAHTHDAIRQLMRCIYAFIPYLRSRGLYQQAEHHLLRALEGAKILSDDDGKAHALLYLGEIAQKRGNYEQANAYLQEGLSIARTIGNPERISALLADLGWITWKRGQYALAENYLQEGLGLARGIDNSEHLCDILETLGSVAASRGEYDKSKEYMEQALMLARRIGDDEKTCTLLINLGVTKGEQGDHAQAEIHFKEALFLARQIGHREWVSLLLTNLGGAEAELGNYSEAEIYFQEGLVFARQIWQQEWISALLLNLGLISQKQEEFTQAEEYFNEGLNLSRQLGNPHFTSSGLYEYGNLLLVQRKTQEAEAIFNEMLVTVPEGGQDLLALAQYGLARVTAESGNIEEAVRLGKISITALEATGHRGAIDVKKWLMSVTEDHDR